MSHQARAALIFVLLAACQSSPTPGASCSTSAECGSPLVCRLGRCRAECSANRDCPVPSRCLLDSNHVGACSLDVDERCMSGGHMCPAGLICVGDQCANTCRVDSDCPPDAICRDAMTAGQRFCFAPDRQDGGPPVDGGGNDAGRDAAQSGDGGSDAGNDASMDAFVEIDGGSDAGNDAANDAGSDAAATPDGGACTGLACGSVADLCATIDATCAIRSSDRRVLCWGHGRTLGDMFDATVPAHTCGGGGSGCSTSPVSVRVTGTGVPLVADQLACASETVCARDGTQVYCWGNNANNELGHAGGVGTSASLVTGLGTPQGLHAGYANFCTHNGSGAATCWGRSTHGELATFASTSAPAVLSGGAANVSLGFAHSCAALTSAVTCRGDDSLGQLGPTGPGGTTGTTTPITVSTFGGGVDSIHATPFGTCILNGGIARCWGTGSCGELGAGSIVEQRTPTQVSTATYRAMWASAVSTVVCAQRYTTEQVDCWGSLYPATGACSAMPTTPVHHPEMDHAHVIALGRQHWCFADASGVVSCAGNNWAGQLARYPAADVDDPTFVPVCLSAACVP